MNTIRTWEQPSHFEFESLLKVEYRILYRMLTTTALVRNRIQTGNIKSPLSGLAGVVDDTIALQIQRLFPCHIIIENDRGDGTNCLQLFAGGQH